MSRTRPGRRTVIPVLVIAVIVIATLGLDLLTAKDAGPAPGPVASSPMLGLVPSPLKCLVTTGFALSCVGLSLS